MFILEGKLPAHVSLHSIPEAYTKGSLIKNLAIINFLVFVLDEFLDAYFKISKYRQSK